VITNDSTLYVCLPVRDPLAFADNDIGECEVCHRSVQYRPGGWEHAQSSESDLHMVCLDCAVMLGPAARQTTVVL
jgi:hypothetical protein